MNISSSSSNQNGSSCEGCAIFSEVERTAIVVWFSLVFIASLVGNLLILVLLRKDQQLYARTSPSHISLAIADLLATVFWLPFLVTDIYIVDGWIFGYAMCKIVIFVQFLSSVSSTLNLCIVTSECFAAVWFPFFLKILPRKRAILIASCTVAWLVGAIDGVIYIQYRTIYTFDDGGQYCTEDWPDLTTMKVFLFTNNTLIAIVPLILITVLNILLIYRLCSTGFLDTRRRHSKRNCNKRFAIKKIVTISLIFAICRFPVYIFNLFTVSGEDSGMDIKSFLTVSTVCYGLYFFSAATHPVLFSLMSTQYKEAIMRNYPCFASPLARKKYSKSTQSSKVLETVF